MSRVTIHIELEVDVLYHGLQGYQPTRTDPGCGDDVEVEAVLLLCPHKDKDLPEIDLAQHLTLDELEHVREMALADFHETRERGFHEF